MNCVICFHAEIMTLSSGKRSEISPDSEHASAFVCSECINILLSKGIFEIPWDESDEYG